MYGNLPYILGEPELLWMIDPSSPLSELAMRTQSDSMASSTAHRTEPERTPDGHHFVIDGRRWRATDPSIPDSFRQELVDELMDARRAVKANETDARGT